MMMLPSVPKLNNTVVKSNHIGFHDRRRRRRPPPCRLLEYLFLVLPRWIP